MSSRTTAALLGLLLLAGCSTGRQLATMKEQAAAGDHRALATAAITCASTDPACAQQHLIKGDACYRRARAGEPAFYDCAVRELGIGVDRAGRDDTAIGSTKPFWENLLEALRQRRDLARSRAEATGINMALLERAEHFALLFEGEPAGAYYAASAELAAVLDRPGMPPAAACASLDRAQARATAVNSTSRYARSLARLRADIATLRTQILRCPS